MNTTFRKAALAAGILLSLPLLLAAAERASQEIQQVLVVNFPKTQTVSGTVAIREPVPLAALAAVKEIGVHPVNPRETSRLVDAGTIATDGFAGAVLSLAGQTRGDVTRSGSAGAILIPDEEPILRAFEERGEILFPLEVAAAVSAGASPLFASNQPRVVVAFPRYRVFLYNTTDKTVSVTLYAYLTP